MDKQEYYHDKAGRFSAVDKQMMGHPEPVPAENLTVRDTIAAVLVRGNAPSRLPTEAEYSCVLWENYERREETAIYALLPW